MTTNKEIIKMGADNVLNSIFKNIKDVYINDNFLKLKIGDMDYFFYKENDVWKYDGWGLNVEGLEIEEDD